MKKSVFLQPIYLVLIKIRRDNLMNIKSKLSILVAIIFSLSFGLTTAGHADGHGHGRQSLAAPERRVVEVDGGGNYPT